ncbi:MAG TPA: hypothetical protein VHW09_03935 [Bryobacteraceae bacterium]|jgi:hypothetical protein|nr:hypothetical protein [Bryobacteraceae bacterium]
MNARILTASTLFTAFAGVFTASAADSQLLSLVMPDAKVIAGVNVDSAKTSPFGTYVLNQMQSNNTDLQDLIKFTGFDPTRDVNEVLIATPSGAGGRTAGLILARGTFDPALATLAATKGAVTEVYNGVTIVESPDKQVGIAFLSTSRVAAGDVANVKAAVDRQGSTPSLSAAVLAQVNMWSASQDAWMVTTVPLSGLVPAQAAGGAQSNGAAMNPMAGVMQQVQQISGGVKFGASVVGTAAIQSDNAADATQLANTLQFFVNLMQMQAQNKPELANVAQGFSVKTDGAKVNLTITLPEAQFQQLFQMEKKAAGAAPQGHVSKN